MFHKRKMTSLSFLYLTCPQVQLYSSLHLTGAVLSQLTGDDGQQIKELWKAVAWLGDAQHFCLSAQLCRLLFPDGTSV